MMDTSKVGQLISSLRKEKGLTQRQLAEKLQVSDRAVSKWERGYGCPDVSLLHALSAALGVHIEKLLAGELIPNEKDGGNMKRVRFYRCPSCGNILCSTGEAEVGCCGRKLLPLEVKEMDAAHAPVVERVEDDFFLTFSHPMEKGHFLAFVAYVLYDRVLLIRLYPEQEAAVRFPQLNGRGEVYVGCSDGGLFRTRLSR